MRATTINDEMKLDATRALAALDKEDVPDSVRRAYGLERSHRTDRHGGSASPSTYCSGGEVNDIVNMAAIAVVDAQERL